MARFFRGEQYQPQATDRGLQPLHRDIAGDLQHNLVLDEAGLSGRRNVDEPPVEARRQLLLTPLRRRSGLLRGQSDAALATLEQRRCRGVERRELTWTYADEIIDDLRRSRQRLEEGRARQRCHRVADSFVESHRGAAPFISRPSTGLRPRRRMISLSMGSCTVSAACLIESHFTFLFFWPLLALTRHFQGEDVHFTNHNAAALEALLVRK